MGLGPVDLLPGASRDKCGSQMGTQSLSVLVSLLPVSASHLDVGHKSVPGISGRRA